MPVFHKYNPSYHKSGYYVKVNWSAPHPYPLQTPAIAEQIYLELGFGPGDKVPNELTSRLFNAGLHWTGGKGAGDPQKQTEIDPITDADLPDIDLEQLESVYDLLENVEGKVEGQDIDAGSLDELRAQLEELSNTASSSSKVDAKNTPDRIAPLIGDILDKEVDQTKAAEMRADAEYPDDFNRSLYQFVRNHPITPRDFRVNDHGDPVYRFRSGSVDWDLADCRPKDLDFDWAVTISLDTERQFELRVSTHGVVRVVHDGSTLSEQQAADLISITPCLIWTLDSLDGYSLYDQWNGAGIRNELPSPHRGWFEDQTKLAVGALNPSDYPTEGVVIDNPDRYFARIRTVDRCIVCTPVNSLSDTAKAGTKVVFETTERYGSLYATDVDEVDDNPEEEIILKDDGKEYSITIPDPQSNITSEKVLETVRAIFENVSPSTALGSEPVRKLATRLSVDDLDQTEQLLHLLLEDTPFTPDIFPELVSDLQTHHQLPGELAFRPIPLALCAAVFYETIDPKETMEDVNQQGDTTVLYKRDDECLIVGNELLWYGVAEPLAAIPDTVEETITETDEGDLHHELMPRAIAALCGRQFIADRPNGDAFVREIIRRGMEDYNANAIYLILDD